ncbi:GerAB/ArcD/ProY family transporter [Alkaliphilus peptidifermentans]|uniref:Spore germination protein KB n=1 Tax=Alkaliphilus peptidifermentans DSM 18978 TaxID=1120976 RepID=A0A1G5EYM5_9FIRM|nr:endospore germination permease [Alkaliphilus peptidifermentans]SCY32014.1 spore germination protein KB [Alkaliphilus peptidifermentans DSM 18978]
MYKKAQISSTQLSILMIGFILGSTIIIVPGSNAMQDAWIAYLAAWIGGFLLFSCYYLLYKKFPQKTLVEINHILLGKWLGTIVNILYIWYFIHLASLVLRNFGEYTLTVTLPETPLWFIMACYVFVTGYSVRSGLEVTARTAELIIPFIFIFQVGIFLILLPYFDISNLKPILAEGLQPVLMASFSVLTFPFGETIILLMILPYLHSSGSVKKTYIFSFLLAGSILLMGIIRDLSVLGADEIARTLFPPHYTIQQIPDLNIDALIGVFFFISGGTKICICYLAATIGIAQLTNSHDHRPFVIPVGIILLGLCIWIYESAPQMLNWAIEIWPLYSIPFQIVIPLMLLIISFFRTKNP